MWLQPVVLLAVQDELIGPLLLLPEQVVLDGDGVAQLQSASIGEVEERGRDLGVADGAHLPEVADQGRRELLLGDVAVVLGREARLVLAAEAQEEEEPEDEPSRRQRQPADLGDADLAPRRVALGVGGLGQALLLGEDTLQSRPAGGRRRRERRGGEEHARLDEGVRRQVGDVERDARVLVDRHRAVQRAVSPGTHLVARDAGRQVDGDRRLADAELPPVADELPVELGRVAVAPGRALDHVAQGEGHAGVAELEVGLHAHDGRGADGVGARLSRVAERELLRRAC